MKRKLILLITIVAVACWAGTAWALTIGPSGTTGALTATGTYNGSYTLSASATFSLDSTGHWLTIVLANTATDTVTDPSEVLTGLVWNSTSPLGSITTSGNLGTDTPGDKPAGNFTLYNSSLVPTTELPLTSFKGEWGYGDSASNLPSGYNRVLCSFDGPTNYYDGGQISGPANSAGGIDYGLVGTTGIGGTNGDITGNPLVGTYGTFTVYFADAFTAQNPYELDENNVRFQYGSNFDHQYTETPLPGALLLLGAGMVRLVAYGRKKRRTAA
jgi:hypothetical protein